MSKRRCTLPCEDSPPPKIMNDGNCIVHFKTIKDFKQFVIISELKDPDKRFELICKIRNRRLAEPAGSTQRMDDVCHHIPSSFNKDDGYHRACYMRFTANLNRLTVPESKSADSDAYHRSPRKTNTTGHIFPKECIFCNITSDKRLLKKGGRSREKLVNFDKDCGKTIQNRAEKKKDETLLRHIRGYDLFASEAKYHQSCKNRYMDKTEEGRWRSRNNDMVAHQSGMQEAHDIALNKIAAHIEWKVGIEKQVLQMSSIHEMYIEELEKTDFPNKKYRNEKLRIRLEKIDKLHNIQFAKTEPIGCVSKYLIFNKDMSITEAICKVYELTSRDSVKDVAQLLRDSILQAFEDANEMAWPIAASDLEMDGIIPPKLQEFLTYVLGGSSHCKSNQSYRLIHSIGQDLCRGVTNGEWKLPKHILLCMTLRHLFRSKQLLTLLNRFGHCESSTFAIELEGAIDMALEQKSTLLTPQIVKAPNNVLFHSEWDNFNQNLTSIHGKSAINTAGGIMLQESEGVTPDNLNKSLPSIPKQSYGPSIPPTSLPSFHIAKRKGPVMDIQSISQPGENDSECLNGLKLYFTWLLCRKACATGKQIVPAYGGFISATGKSPLKRTTIEYYPWIPEPITEYNVVKELLDKSEEATKEVGQNYTITTFDLGVCMKALPIIWNNPDDYQNHIILIGIFHAIMNYLNMIGHKMAGSGYAELLGEAGLITSGCLKQVLNGRSYTKSLWCLKIVSESLERLLLQSYIDHNPDIDGNADTLDALIKMCNPETLAAAMGDDSVTEYLKKYMDFQVIIKKH